MAACVETPTKRKSENRSLGVYRSPTPTKEYAKDSQPGTSVEAHNEFGNYYSSYLWTFENFSKYILTKHEEMTAPVFKFAGCRWAMVVNLYQVSSDNNFTVVVSLDKTTSDITHGMVKWSVSLVDRYGVGRRMKEGTLSIAKAKSWEVFSLKRSSMLDEDYEKFLPDDCLAIRLDLLVENLFPCQQSWLKNRGYELLQSENCLVSLSNDLANLFEKKRDVDVVLQARDSQFPVHKIILSCRSEGFAKIFQEMAPDERDLPIDMESSDIRLLLNYIYTGIIPPDLSIERVCSIYTVAYKYGVASLKTWCRKQMVDRLERSNFLQILQLARKYSDTCLKYSVMDYLIFNGRMFLTEEWIKFSNISDNQGLALEILNGYMRKSLGASCGNDEEYATTTVDEASN